MPPFERLSQYSLFVGEPAVQQPAPGVIPYDLNSALFSDYAEKFRFIKLPPGTRGLPRQTRPSISRSARSLRRLSPSRATPRAGRRKAAGRDPDPEARARRLGRPALHLEQGTNRGDLDVAGDTVDVSWIHTDGRTRTNNYIIPNANQCKGCHKAGETTLPIGPKARHLNRDFAYPRWNRKPVDALEQGRCC